jgi:small subunit ribosomal protein S6
MKETVAKFKKVLTDKGAEIVNEETWGLKKMAYAIQKKSTGFYCLLEFKADPTLVKVLETEYRRDERVIRFQTVKLEKHAIAYAEKRRNKMGKKRRGGLNHGRSTDTTVGDSLSECSHHRHQA